jgi:prepilin-type N-terminal cleavage/methylation domain-containing protein
MDHSSREKGFTLMEMMLTVAIILVLAAVGIISYNKMRQRSYNAGAQHMAVQIQKTQGIYHTTNKEWANTMDQLLALDKNLLDTPNITYVWLASDSSGYTVNVKHESGTRWFTASQQ